MPFTPPKTIALTDVALNPAAPLSAVQPSVNPVVNGVLGASPAVIGNLATNAAVGWEVPAIAVCLNVAIDFIKNLKWFREEHWTVPLLFVLGFVVSLVVWHFFFDDVRKGVTNAFAIIAQSHLNYKSSLVSGIGVFAPTAEANKFGA